MYSREKLKAAAAQVAAKSLANSPSLFGAQPTVPVDAPSDDSEVTFWSEHEQRFLDADVWRFKYGHEVDGEPA